ncbi:MAG: Peptide/nickel transport system substrate-binding protein [Ilumatobacteraceae bacterium]|nr:Peptide/nickel transport system substrate-binding protein [Ilumatobacteraceae bacterium]
MTSAAQVPGAVPPQVCRRDDLRRVRRVLAAAGALIVGVSACSSSAASPARTGAASTSPAATPALPARDSLIIATSFAIDDLDPLNNGFWAPEFGYGDLLMRPLPGGELEPWVLRSLEHTDPTTWTLTLRPDVTFGNGTSLDGPALAALLTWQLANNEAVKPLLTHATAVSTGPLTVELTTTAPAPNVPSLLADESGFNLFDLPTYLAHRDHSAELVDAKIYVGPYTVTGLGADEMDLVPTPGYYGGTPALKTLTVKFVPDADARIKAVQTGEADIALYPPTAAARQLANRTDAYFIEGAPGTGVGGQELYVNLRTPAMSDVLVRQALQHAIDYGQIAAEVLNGLYDEAIGLYPAFEPYAQHDLEFDQVKAGQLLGQAGWVEPAGGGTRTKNGTVLSLTVLTYPQQPDIGVVAVAVQAQLKAVGIDLQIKQVDDIYAAMQEPSGWDFGISNDSALDFTGTDPVKKLVETYATGGITNFGGISDLELDRIIATLQTTTDDAIRTDLLHQAQTLIVTTKAYGWFLNLKRSPVVVGPELRGYPVPASNQWLTPYS